MHRIIKLVLVLALIVILVFIGIRLVNIMVNIIGETIGNSTGVELEEGSDYYVPTITEPPIVTRPPEMYDEDSYSLFDGDLQDTPSGTPVADDYGDMAPVDQTIDDLINEAAGIN